MFAVALQMQYKTFSHMSTTCLQIDSVSHWTGLLPGCCVAAAWLLPACLAGCLPACMAACLAACLPAWLLLLPGCCLAAGCWLLAAGCWLLVVGLVGCWLLVV